MCSEPYLESSQAAVFFFKDCFICQIVRQMYIQFEFPTGRVKSEVLSFKLVKQLSQLLHTSRRLNLSCDTMIQIEIRTFR